MKPFYFWALAGWLLWPARLPAQQTVGDFFPVDPTLLIRALQGSNVSFHATVDISGRGPRAEDNFDVQLQYALLEGRLRTELNLSRLQGLSACEIAQGRLAQLGLDEVIFISLPDLELSYYVYPRLHAYYEVPHTWRDRVKAIVDIESTPLGPVSLEGERCEKHRLRVVNHLGEATDILAWYATDAGHFPVQLQFLLGPQSFTMRFRGLDRRPPPGDWFQPPADYDRYPSLRDLSRQRGLDRSR